jgi:putative tryptophan/tyrosine transport system substrate-binding protein
MIRNKNSRRKPQGRQAILVGFTLIALLLHGCGSKQEKVYHVGILSGLDFFSSTADGFKAKMTELGYIEGKNIIYDIQKTQFDPAAEQRILKTFISNKVDLIFTFPTEVSVLAKDIAKETGIPVLFANANIEGVNLVKSVREPGGNITGVRYPGPDIALKRFEIMLQLMPHAKRILVPYQRNYPIITSQMEVLRPVALSKGVTLIELPASNALELQSELEKLSGSHIDCILFIPEPLAVTPDGFAVLGKFAAKHKLPMGGALMSTKDYSSVFGIATDNITVGKQAAVLVDKIFKGTAAGSIPVVSAENFLQLNYKAAHKQGLNVSESLLNQANEIIR